MLRRQVKQLALDNPSDLSLSDKKKNTVADAHTARLARKSGIRLDVLDKPALTATVRVSSAGYTGPQHLRTLRLDVHPICQLINHDILSVMADGNLRLRHLSLSNCRALTDAAIVQMVLATAHSLASLDLSYCWKLSDMARLDLSHVSLLSDIGLAAVGDQLASTLRSLNVSECRCISDRGLLHLIDKLNPPSRPISGLVTGDTARRGLENAQGSGGNLVELRFRGCSKITRTGFVHLLTRLHATQPRLRILEFTVPSAPLGTPPLLHSMRTFPVDACAKLHQLHIHSAHILDDGILLQVVSSCAPRLQALTLQDTSRTQSDLLADIVGMCTNLVSLSLSGAAHLPHAAMNALAMLPSFHKLQVLDFSWCQTLKDDALLLLTTNSTGNRSQSLSALLLSNCRQLTLAGVHAVAQSLLPPAGHLSVLDITGLSNNHCLQELEAELDGICIPAADTAPASGVVGQAPFSKRANEMALSLMVPAFVGVDGNDAAEPHVLVGSRLAAFQHSSLQISLAPTQQPL
ncbi:hypothetical protein BC831DRAFT_451652 [Entophlyctis helioformis]|nr:hypothetical protein BC831DRAFT_451652 [Entophlyctis helioformis]